jgi:hypothetical protein
MSLEAGAVGNAAPYIDAARALAPQIQSLRQEIESQRTLPTELVEAMTKAGLCRLWRCDALGGPELTFAEFALGIEELSRLDRPAFCLFRDSIRQRLVLISDYDEVRASLIIGMAPRHLPKLCCLMCCARLSLRPRLEIGRLNPHIRFDANSSIRGSDLSGRRTLWRRFRGRGQNSRKQSRHGQPL